MCQIPFQALSIFIYIYSFKPHKDHRWTDTIIPVLYRTFWKDHSSFSIASWRKPKRTFWPTQKIRNLRQSGVKHLVYASKEQSQDLHQ